MKKKANGNSFLGLADGYHEQSRARREMTTFHAMNVNTFHVIYRESGM